MDIKQLERSLPFRFYEIVESSLALLSKAIGQNLTLEGDNAHPDFRAGRTDLGTTYEDFHLFWPIRPKVWLSYPSGSSDNFQKFSRDDLLLQEEQRTFVNNDNAMFLGQRQSPSALGIYSNKLFVNQQKQLNNIYKQDVDLHSDMKVHEEPSISYSSKTHEFWQDHPVDRAITERKFFTGLAIPFIGFLPIFAYTHYKFAKSARARPLRIPFSILFGITGAVGTSILCNSLTEMDGHNHNRWISRVYDGLRDYSNTRNVEIPSKKELPLYPLQ